MDYRNDVDLAEQAARDALEESDRWESFVERAREVREKVERLCEATGGSFVHLGPSTALFIETPDGSTITVEDTSTCRWDEEKVAKLNYVRIERGGRDDSAVLVNVEGVRDAFPLPEDWKNDRHSVGVFCDGRVNMVVYDNEDAKFTDDRCSMRAEFLRTATALEAKLDPRTGEVLESSLGQSFALDKRRSVVLKRKRRE